MITILIVDDSNTDTQILKTLFESQPDMKVVGCAKNGKQAVEMAASLSPDLITMDLQMPEMDGHTATRIIMSQNPVPIVVISSQLQNASIDMTYLALEAGAVSVLNKPRNINSNAFESYKKILVDTIRSMSEIKVIKRRFNLKDKKEKIIPYSETFKHQNYELLAIGTSIGGPQALKTIFSMLPTDFPLPIVVVQHMTKGFMTGFTEWMNHNLSFSVKNAEQNEVLSPGFIYFAPDQLHLTINRKNSDLIVNLKPGEAVSGFCPSITVLLQSVASTCKNRAIGILLTGMGYDGAQGLLELKQAGGHTIIQDKNSCVVFGMAGVAQNIGAVDKIIELNQIAEYLIKITRKN